MTSKRKVDQLKKAVFEKNAFEFEVLGKHVIMAIGLIIPGPNLNLKTLETLRKIQMLSVFQN